MNNSAEQSNKATSSFVWVLVAIGISLRFILNALSHGTNDIDSWHYFAKFINSNGLYALYLNEPLFNHPPLAAACALLVLHLAQLIDIPFAIGFRLGGILCDCGSVILIYRIWSAAGGRKAASAMAAYALSPIAILICGYHGNTDPIYIFFLMLAAYWAASQNLPFLAGLAAAVSFNIKIIPLLFMVPLLVICRSNAARLKFSLAATLGTIPFAIGIFNGGQAFWRNIFQYNSTPEYWGIPLFLMLFKNNASVSLPDYVFIFDAILAGYLSIARLLVVGAVLYLCYRSSRIQQFGQFQLLGLCTAIFCVLSPGLGVQYFALLAALAAAHSLSWGLRLSLATGFAALVSYLYFSVGAFPFRSVHLHTAPKGIVLVNFLVWIVILLYLCSSIGRDSARSKLK